MGLYTDIAKQVHPDVSGISDATTKMQEVNKNKNNPDKLIELARKWGLSIDGKKFDETKFDRKADGYDQRVYEAVVGAIVTWASSNRRIGRVRGVITNVRNITRGKFSGAKEYTVYNFATQGVVKIKCWDFTPTLVGMADSADLEHGQKVVSDIKTQKKAVADAKQAYADDKMESLGLRKNYDYRDNGLKVLINYSNKQLWKPLIRTTPKSAYVWESKWHVENGKQRRIDIKHILEVRSIV